MLLRRVIEHVREQNWTAIGIDFVIVVVGVFVGIQVANWNASLADERLGRAYASRLEADLEADLAWQRSLAAYYQAVLGSVESANALLADPQSDAQQLVVNLYRASEINYRAPSRATWDEIVSSGHTALLQREVARSAADYFALDAARNVLDILNNSAYRHRVRALIPLDVQKALRSGCSDVRDDLQQITGFVADCSLDVAPGVLAATAAALRADPTVQTELRQQYSDVYSAHANISGSAAVIERALTALKGARPAMDSSP
jgi:hypothetical protein